MRTELAEAPPLWHDLDMSNTPSLQHLVWLMISILGHGALIAAAIVLLRGRGVAPWLILFGAIIGLVGGAGGNILSMLSTTIGFSRSFQIITAISSLGALGWLIVCAGVLILAFPHRALVTRASELESILSAHRGN